MSLSVQDNLNKMKLVKNINKVSSRNPIPLKWNLDEKLENIYEYLNFIIKDQIIFDGFSSKSIEFLDLRSKIVNQIIQICCNFNLRNETLFKTVEIFDMYCWKISKFQTFQINNTWNNTEDRNVNSETGSGTSSLTDLLKELKIIIVICLNIACKYEEINCNYISYFKSHLLDEENEVYDLKCLIKKETEILKIINFKLTTPSFYAFNIVFVQLVIIEYLRSKNNKQKCEELQNFISNFVRLNDVIVKVYCTLHESVYISPLYSGLICIKATFIYFENLYKSNLSHLDKHLSAILNSTNYEIEFDFIERISSKLFSLIKSKNLKLLT